MGEQHRINIMSQLMNNEQPKIAGDEFSGSRNSALSNRASSWIAVPNAPKVIPRGKKVGRMWSNVDVAAPSPDHGRFFISRRTEQFMSRNMPFDGNPMTAPSLTIMLRTEEIK